MSNGLKACRFTPLRLHTMQAAYTACRFFASLAGLNY